MVEWEWLLVPENCLAKLATTDLAVLKQLKQLD